MTVTVKLMSLFEKYRPKVPEKRPFFPRGLRFAIWPSKSGSPSNTCASSP